MADGEDEAARAFESLRAEVALMRRAVERLAAERTELPDAPDYSETLGIISQNLSGTAQRVDALMKSPALAMTPETISRQIDAAGYTVRVEDHRVFAAAKQGLEEMMARLGRYLQSDIAAGEQRRRLWYAGLIGFVLGMVAWASLAGPIARAMPASWLWPERMAARSLRLPMWGGGQRLMRAASPQSFAGIVADNQLSIANHDALDTCHKEAARAKKAVRCTLRIRPEEER